MASFRLPTTWPVPADAARATRLATLIKPRPGHPQDAALIACLGGNSPYLADLAVREKTCFDQLIRQGPASIVDTALATLAGLDPRQPRAAIAAALRQAKRQVALAAGVADIGSLWNLEQVTTALSNLAEAALGASIRHLLLAAAARRELLLPNPASPEQGSGFIVLGMGKLGARELNYSSDIDLMLLYDPDAYPVADHPGHEDLRRIFVRMSNDLVALMQTRDAGGYVFRTDLRLRPDPASTPPAVSLPAALTYYESHGQTWERAAMTKARPVAGDLARGQSFLEAIRPFIWRRNLDFPAFEDIRAMKRRIDRHKNATSAKFPIVEADPVERLLGHDLKLGHGGIREIEFMAQTMQLVWAGRAPELRDPTTLGALGRLADGNYLPAGLAAELASTYALLRRAEHRLQMQDDRQTHSLPTTREAFDAFARFMGESDADALAATLLTPLVRTRDAFEALFSSSDPAESEPVGPEFDLDGDDLSGQLDAIGFPQPARAAGILAIWQRRQLRALRSDRAYSLLREILPALLRTFREQRDPVLVLTRFDTLLARQSAGIQLLSLFGRNPPLIGRLAAVLNAAPWLADHLAAVPAALEGLLVPEEGKEAEKLLLRLVDAQLQSADSLEEAIRRARLLVRGEEFRLSLAQMDGRLDVDQAGEARSALTDRVIARMLDQVLCDHLGRFGRVAGGGMVVVALGKAGSREMMAGSDLDLMLVYDHSGTAMESAFPGSRPGSKLTLPMQGSSIRKRTLPVSQYYTRLAHSLIAALSAPGAGGPLYALDMRLRPSGSKGPVAVSLASFERYHAERSWTWERMALSRARVVAGPQALRTRVAAAIRIALDRPEISRETLLHDACAMRARLAAELPPHGRWDVKLRPGGLMEVEFIAQIMQVASRDPALRHPTTRLALRRLAKGGMLTSTDAAMLIETDRFWRSVQSMLRILFGTKLPASLGDAGSPALDALLHGVAASAPGGAGIEDANTRDAAPAGLDGLERRMDQAAHAVRGAFIRLIGKPETQAGHSLTGAPLGALID